MMNKLIDKLKNVGDGVEIIIVANGHDVPYHEYDDILRVCDDNDIDCITEFTGRKFMEIEIISKNVIKLSDKMHDLIGKWYDDLYAYKILKRDHIISDKDYNKYIIQSHKEFSEMLRSMFHFGLLTKNDLLLENNINIYHILYAILDKYLFDEKMPYFIF